MAKKKVAAIVKIQIPAGKATPAPPVGTALGPHGVGIMDFVKQYNAATESQVGTIIPVEITVFEDRTFTFILKTPPAPVLLRQKAGLAKGSTRPGQDRRRHGHRGRHRRSRQDQDARPQRLRPRSCQAADPWHRPLDGPQGRRLSRVSQFTVPTTTARPGRPRPAALTTEGDRQCQERSSQMRSKKFDRDQLFTPTEALALVKTMAKAKFDETVDVAVRLGVDPRKADQMVRGTVALPEGTGKDVRVAVFATGEAAQAGPRRRRRHRRRRRPGRRDREGQHGLRPRHRHARHDAARRSPRPRARPAWPDAEPEDRHRHPRRRPCRRRVQGRQGRVPHRPLRQRARARSARPASSPTRSRPTSVPCSTSCSAPSRRRPRAATCKKITVSSTMGPGVKVDTTRLRPEVGHPDHRP